MLQIADLNFPLAIRRVRRDMRDDWFVDPLQYADILVPSLVKKWFSKNDRIHPTEELNIPKAGFVIRSAHEMIVYERVLYQALIDQLVEEYDPLLRSDVVYSHRLREGQKEFIFQNTIDAWKAFNDDVDIAMDSDSKVLVVTDIQNYYQCIHYDQLCDQLLEDDPNAQGSYDETIERLRELLHGWNPEGVGLPQNRDASSFLGNMFLRGIDEYMILKGYNYRRYMDDVRIVCEDVYAARRALQDLIIKLRESDLGVNGKKTMLLYQSTKEYQEAVPLNNPKLEEIDALFSQKNVRSVRKARIKVDAYADELMSNGETTGKEFRFCINRIERLARCVEIDYDPSRFVDSAIELLVEQPWSSEMLTRLIRSSTPSNKQTQQLVELLLCDRRNIYDWQSFLLWQLIAVIDPSYQKDQIKQSARNAISADRAVPYKAGAALYLGARGNLHDKRHLMQECSGVSSNMLSRAVAIATQNLKAPSDKTRRKKVVPDYYQESTDKYEGGDGLLRFFAPLSGLRASQIYNDLPCFYF